MDELQSLHRYAQIKLEMSRLEAELDELKPVVADYVDSHGGQSFNLPFKGTFYFTERKTWEYSDAVKEGEDILKKLKIDEQEAGAAKIKNILRILTWKADKE